MTAPLLVIGSTGKTGRRVAQRLEAMGLPVRHGSRSAEPGFDWHDRSTWAPALQGVQAMYITYFPDLAVPGAPDDIRALTELAKGQGVQRVVLLSGRGEVEAQRCEQIVMASGLAWTVVRASWFSQNFSEGAFRDMVIDGVLPLPAGDMVEPFVDVDDIADVAVSAMTEEGHAQRVYEVTGPELLSFHQIAEQLAEASGRSVRYQPIAIDQFTEALAAQGLPADVIGLLSYLFTEVLDGRNAQVVHGVQQALGRPARSFAQYARNAAAQGAWIGKEVAQ